MSETFLLDILAETRKRVRAQRRLIDIDDLRRLSRIVRAAMQPHLFRSALSDHRGPNIIAEIKRASPSKGVINHEINVGQVVREYEGGGACAISVLTEPAFFHGSLDDLVTARLVTELPLLRKEFIVDELQIHESAIAGADAILLIVAALDAETIESFRELAEEQLGMDALVEVHTLDELEVAGRIGSTIIGINNRDLRTFETSLDVSRQLISARPAGSLMVSESGISGPDDIHELRSMGFDGFLIGETLMRSGRPGNLLAEWTKGGGQ